MKSITRMIVSLACVSSLVSVAWAAVPKDITTRTNPDGSLNVEARYLVHVGYPGYSDGLTSAVGVNSRGLAEYHSSGGVSGTGNWGRMNNGITVYGTRTPVTGDTGFMCATAMGTGIDYVGYLFNAPVTPTQVKFWNTMCANGIPGQPAAGTSYETRNGGGPGGTFAATPELQYLDAPDPAGTWHTITNVTWDVPYDPTLPTGLPAPAANGEDASDIVTRAYQISINESLNNVWGLRLIGAPNASGGNTVDPDGYIGVQELAVIGTLDIGETDLSINKALTGTAIANAAQFGAGSETRLNDGLFNADYFPTYGPWAGEDYLGITWASPQYGITSLGVAFLQFFDGGLFNDCVNPLRIEYTTTSNPDWTPVTGLDKHRYPYVWQRISYFGSGNPRLAFLFSFDELNDVTGLRIIGDPDGDGGDRDGFLGAYEVEVFGRRILAQICDYDSDGDVDGADLALFMKTADDVFCLSAPTVPVSQACKARDLDRDGDVDQMDFGLFQLCYSGSGIPYDPTCGE